MNTYSCGINTGTHGLKYERELPFMLFTRASIWRKEFELAIEHSESGVFDDCVFRYLSGKKKLFIQAKHKQRKAPISYTDIFQTPSGDFDIIKYIKSGCEIEKNSDGEKQFFIFTNLPLDDGLTNPSEGVRVETRTVDELMNFKSRDGLYEGLVLSEEKIRKIADDINSEFNRLKDHIIRLFDPSCKEIQPAFANLKLPLSSILTKYKKCLKFSDDAIGTPLYETLKKHFESQGQKIEQLVKNVEGMKDIDKFIKGDTRKQLPMCIDKEQIEYFLKKLTFCTSQPEDLPIVAREDIRLLMRSWVMPEELGSFAKEGTEIPMKRFQDEFDAWFSEILAAIAIKENRNKLVLWLTWKRGNDLLRRLENEFTEKTIAFRKYYVNRKVRPIRKWFKRVFYSYYSDTIMDTDFVHKLGMYFVTQKCLLVVGEPGIGKTLFLRYVSHQMQITFRCDVFLINLKSLQNTVKNAKISLVDENIYDIFGSFLSIDNIQKLKTGYKSGNRNVIFLFDGFDEVHKHSQVFLKIFQQLLKSGVRMVISGRYNVKSTLERAFEMDSVELDPLEYDDQVAIFKMHWNVSEDEATMQKFHIFSVKLLEKFNSLMKLPGNPLIVSMLAKVFLDRFEAFLNSDTTNIDLDLLTTKSCSIVSLYSQFMRTAFMMKIGKKYKHNAYSEVEPFDEEYETFYEEFVHNHQILAVQQCNINGINLSTENEKYLRFEKRIRNGEETSVIISTAEGKTELFHLTFAEYLVALFLYEHLRSCEKKLYEILERNEGIRRFVMTIIEENFSESNSQLNILIDINVESYEVTYWACEAACVEVVKALLRNGRDTKFNHIYYGSLLHVASRVGCYDLVLLLIDEYKMKPHFVYNLNSTPIEYAVEFGHLKVVKLLTSRVDSNNLGQIIVDPSTMIEDNRVEITKYLIRANILSTAFREELLRMAIYEGGEFGLIRLLLDYGVNLENCDKLGRRPLHIAAEAGYIECVKLLIARGADINSRADDGRTPFLCAIRIKNDDSRSECLQELLSHNLSIEVNVKDSKGHNAFHYAAKVGRTELIETLIALGVDINSQSSSGQSPLATAAKINQIEFLRQLLRQPQVNVELKDENGLTALHHAILNGNSECVNLLIDGGADVNYPTPENKTPLLLTVCTKKYTRSSQLECLQNLLASKSIDVEAVDDFGKTALHYAAENGHSDCMELLLEKGADVHVLSKSGKTPLHLASEKDHCSCVKMLLTTKSVDIKDMRGFTALHYAAFVGSVDCIQLLIDFGADLNARTDEGKTALHLACEKSHFKIAKQLISNDSFDVSVSNRTNHSALHLIAQWGWTEFVSDLIQKGVDVNAQSTDGKTALHLAASEKCRGEIIAELLSIESIKVNVKDSQKRTPLQYAVQAGHKDYLELLLAKQADIYIKTEYGETLLHLAVRNNSFACAEHLLKTGRIDVNIKDNVGLTALHYVVKNGQYKLVQMLVTHGADVNSRSPDGFTAVDMMLSVEEGDGDYDECLKEMLLCCKTNDKYAHTALHDVTKQEFTNCSKHLMQHGAEHVNLENSFGCLALKHAAINDSEEYLELLIGHGANLNAQDRNGKTSLHFAIEGKHLNFIRKLCTKGTINVRILDNLGWTALHYAARNGFEECVELLLNCGADINCKTHNGETALHVAAWHGHSEFIKKLLSFDSLDVTIKDDEDQTVLHHVARHGFSEYVDLLVERGIALNARTKRGKTAFLIAAEKAHPELMEKLLSFKSLDISIEDERGFTALHYAAEHGIVEHIQLMVARGGFDILNVQNKKGQTPLHIAVYNMQLDFVDQLLTFQSINANLRDQFGSTALHYVVEMKILYKFMMSDEIPHLMLDGRKEPIYCNSKNEGYEKANFSDAQSGLMNYVTWLMNTHPVPPFCYGVRRLNIELLDATVKDADGFTALHYAARHGIVDYLQQIMDNGKLSALHSQTNEGETPLHFAIKYEESYFLDSLLIYEQLDVNITDKFGCTALHYLARRNWEMYIHLLDIFGADLNAQDMNGKTPLHLAVEHRNLSFVQELCTFDTVNVSVPDFSGLTALHYAALHGVDECIELFLNCGADIDCRTRIGQTALHIAAWNRRSEFVRKLLFDYSSNVALKDNQDYTVLHCIAYSGLTDCVELVVGRGVAINARTKSGQTAFNIAAEYNHPELMGKLLSFDSLDVTVQDARGFTALHYAAKHGFVEHLQLTIERGGLCALNAQNDEGETPLHIAIKCRKLVFLEHLLIYRELNCNLKDKFGYTALHHVAANDLERFVELLVNRGNDINAQDSTGKTPLHLAVEHRNIRSIRNLCSIETINVRIRDDSGWTVLHCAAKTGFNECIELLLTHGADIDCKTPDEQTALLVAAWHGRSKFAGKLLFTNSPYKTQTEMEDYAALQGSSTENATQI